MTHNPHIYVHSDVPAGMMLRAWRRHRTPAPVTRRHHALGLVVFLISAVLGWRYA